LQLAGQAELSDATEAKVAIQMDDAGSLARMAAELKKLDHLKDEDLNLNVGPLGDLM
jgi:hypothetical protein